MGKWKPVDWWGYVKRIIADYPRLKYDFDLNPSGLSEAEKRRLAAVEAAITATQALADGDLHLAVVKMYLMARTHNVHGAALRVNVAGITAQRWAAAFVRLVAMQLNLP